MNCKRTSSRPVTLLATATALSSPPRLVILKGLHAACLERGWTLQHCGVPDLADAIEDCHPDAVTIVLDDVNEMVSKILSGQRVISAGHDLTSWGWPSVIPDDVEIGRQAARHFLDRGLQSLAVFGYWDDPAGNKCPWALRRGDGFAELARADGIAIRWYGAGTNPKTGQREIAHITRERTQRWLSALPKPIGVLAACDGWGQVLVGLCREMGFRIPEDVAIVGVDNMPCLCEICDPPLSSVAVQWEGIGKMAVELAGSAIAGQKLPLQPKALAPTGVTVRRSSDILAIDDPDVATALAIILAHADRPLSVAQILRQVPATRKSLQRHFRKIVGRPMIDEIRRVHVERAKRLLAESDLPMPAIARKSGFTSSPGLAIAFRQETGTTPSKFRHSHRP
jgi:LacI family transcriptional regulator